MVRKLASLKLSQACEGFLQYKTATGKSVNTLADLSLVPCSPRADRVPPHSCPRRMGGADMAPHVDRPRAVHADLYEINSGIQSWLDGNPAPGLARQRGEPAPILRWPLSPNSLPFSAVSGLAGPVRAHPLDRPRPPARRSRSPAPVRSPA